MMDVNMVAARKYIARFVPDGESVDGELELQMAVGDAVYSILLCGLGHSRQGAGEGMVSRETSIAVALALGTAIGATATGFGGPRGTAWLDLVIHIARTGTASDTTEAAQ